MKILAFVFILAGVLLRLLPHEPNFAPIAAIALFSGVYLPKKYALIVPMAAIIISDLFIGFHNTIFFTWGSFLLIGLIGIYLKKRKNVLSVITAALAGSLLFFVITNFGVFILNSWYPKTLEGFIQCYLMAVPFFRNTVASDFFYTTVFFASYELIRLYCQKKVLKKEPSMQKSNS